MANSSQLIILLTLPATKQLHGGLRGMENKFKLGYRIMAEILKHNQRLEPDEKLFIDAW